MSCFGRRSKVLSLDLGINMTHEHLVSCFSAEIIETPILNSRASKNWLYVHLAECEPFQRERANVDKADLH